MRLPVAFAIASALKHGQVIVIMEALKRSLERVPAKKKPDRQLREKDDSPEINSHSRTSSARDPVVSASECG